MNWDATLVGKLYSSLSEIEFSINELHSTVSNPSFSKTATTWKETIASSFEICKAKGILFVAQKRLDLLVKDLEKIPDDLSPYQISLLLDRTSWIEKKIQLIAKMINKELNNSGEHENHYSFSDLDSKIYDLHKQFHKSPELSQNLYHGFTSLLALYRYYIFDINKKPLKEVLPFYLIIHQAVISSTHLTPYQKCLLTSYIKHHEGLEGNGSHASIDENCLISIKNTIEEVTLYLPDYKGLADAKQAVLLAMSKRENSDIEDFVEIKSVPKEKDHSIQLFGDLKDPEILRMKIENLSWSQRYVCQDWIQAYSRIQQEKKIAEEKRIAEERQRIKDAEEAARRKEYLKTFSEQYFKLSPAEIDLAEFNTYLGEELEECIQYLYQKSPKALTDEQKTTLFLLFEKTAERYVANDKCQAAMRVRLQAKTFFTCSTEMELLSSKSVQPSALGTKITGFGCTALKNHVLFVSYDDLTQTLVIRGRLTHFTRHKLKMFVEAIKKDPELFKNYGVEYKLENYTRDVLSIKELGEFSIGSHTKPYIPYMDFSVAVNDQNSGHKIYEILCLLGLGEIGQKPREMDNERIRIFQFFRARYPKEVYPLERSQEAFEMPINHLKMKMLTTINSTWENELEKTTSYMYQQQVYPGFSIWAVKGLSEEIKRAGAVGLMMGIGCTGIDRRGREQQRPFTESALHAVSMLKIGVLSTYDRRVLQMDQSGVSAGSDYFLGGGDSVYCRLFHSDWTNKNYGVEHISFAGFIQFIIDIKILDRVGYGFPADSYGSKLPGGDGLLVLCSYKERSNLIDMVRGKIYLGNEVLIKHRIPPEYILGILVQTEQNKALLTTTFYKNKMTLINGTPVEQFIHVGNYFKKSYWTQKPSTP